MIYCLNPDCPQPENADNVKYCVSCGREVFKQLRNRYTVIRALGRGGFGKTYLAEDADRLNAICVIKQFAPDPFIQGNSTALEKAQELFNKEAEQLLHLGEEHWQIPTLFQYFEENKYLYLVQQYIKGNTLLQELIETGSFNEHKIWSLLGDLLPVLQFIHDKNVIHRDIKPENIIRRDSDGRLILIDFGVAKQTAGTLLSRQGTTAGTPGYAPSEQMRGVAFPSSDLYSLGVTCVRLMTNIFPEDDGSDLLYDFINGVWLWRENLPVGVTVSQELGEVLDKLLQDLPKNRYQSAQDVLNALNYGPVSPPPSPPQPKMSAASKPSLNLKTFSFEVISVNNEGIEINREPKQAEYFTEDLGGAIILEMVSIPGGKFSMGSPILEASRSGSESPQHWVTVAPFYMGKYAVTQAQWKAVAGLGKVKRDLNPSPSYFKGENRPVEQISWDDAIEFCARLSKETGKNYRLPSEAEWEYACRAGTSTPFYFGETITPNLVNYDGNYSYALASTGKYRHQTIDVGSFPPNAFGLYDMHGNVSEWCQDVWHDNYNGTPSDGSVWEKGGNQKYRLLRGGSWFNVPWYCRSANRDKNESISKYRFYGFRVVAID